MRVNSLYSTAPMEASQQKRAAKKHWQKLLRMLGLKTRSPNLIMVDFASRDPRSIKRWLHAITDMDEEASQQALLELLKTPLLSESDIRKCLGDDARPRVHRGSAPVDEDKSSC